MKRLSIILTLTLIFSLNLQAQKPIIVHLWPNGAPNSNGCEGNEKETKSIVTNITDPTITVYPSKRANSKAIIQCPGGGYAFESNGWGAYAPVFNNWDITYIVLKYRLPNGGHDEATLSDVQEAVRIVRHNAREWNINPNEIGIMGSSAGGHLAAMASNLYTADSKPDFQILLYPVITMEEKYTHAGTRKNLLGPDPTPEKVKRYSMNLQVSEYTPRAFIVLSEDDKTVPPINSIDYYVALLNHNVSATIHIYPTGGHGFGMSETMPWRYQWISELEKWLTTF
jgi:acetyl esterase/lipase